MDVNAIDASNTPTPPNDCQAGVCDAMGNPGLVPLAASTPCHTYMGSTTGVCDGAGHCVGCVVDADCSAGHECIAEACLP
jgi:hypothetical protein